MAHKKLIVALIAVLALALPVAAQADSSAPAKFFHKNYRLAVGLQDWNEPVFDATLLDIPASVPANAAQYISDQLGDATFELDASGARCYLSQDGGPAERVDCSDLGGIVDESPDPVCAWILARPYVDEDGDLAFAAKKITVAT